MDLPPFFALPVPVHDLARRAQQAREYDPRPLVVTFRGKRGGTIKRNLRSVFGERSPAR